MRGKVLRKKNLFLFRDIKGREDALTMKEVII